MDQAETDELRIRIADVEAQRVPLNEVARWFAPWMLGGALVVICLGGLICASSAPDDATYDIGIAAAILAIAALFWEIGAAPGDGIGDLADRTLVDDADSLVVLVGLLTVMAIGGLILAARGDSPAAAGAGWGLCAFALVFIFANLKHYFDRRENRA